jgi:hypothetical protein
MNNHTMKWIVLGFASAVVFCSAHALAETQENRLKNARKQMELGQEAFNLKNYSEAAVYFEAAFEASPFAAFLYNAGLACEKGHNAARAVEFYRRYLELEPEASDASEIAKKIETLAVAVQAEPSPEQPAADAPSAEPETRPASEAADPEADPEVEMKSLISIRTNPENAAIRILSPDGTVMMSSAGGGEPSVLTVQRGTYIVEASHPDYRTVTTEISVTSGQVYVVVVEMSQGAFLGFLRVTSDIPGAEVFIDSLEAGPAGVTPFGNVIPAGEHTIWVGKPGYVRIEQKVDVAVGDEAELNLLLDRLPFGALKVKTNVKNAEVFVNGKSEGLVDEKFSFTRLLPSGKYQVRVFAEGMKDYVSDVAVEGGKESKLLVRMNPKPSRTSGFVSAGFSLALFGAGSAFGGIALNRRNSLRADRRAGRLASDDPRALEGLLWAVGADISFAVGAIVAGMSLYYFLRDPLPPSEGKLREPVDFTENPKSDPAAEKASDKTRRTSTSARSRIAPRWQLSPMLGRDTAGLGFQIVF